MTDIIDQADQETSDTQRSSAGLVEFSLAAVTSEVLNGTEASETRGMAAEVCAAIPDCHLRQALFEALVPYVRAQAAHVRKQTRDAAATGASRGKWAGVSSIYHSFLNSFIAIPGGGQKRRGELSLDEQRSVAAYRKQQAAAMLKEVEREFMFVRAMESAGVARVADLSEVTVLEILRWEPTK